MTTPEILLIDRAFFPQVLALNNEHAAELSLLDEAGLERLVGQAFRASRIGTLDAFLIALDQDAAYGSPNFQWFKARMKRFVYVDRVCVSGHARGRGLARLLYLDLFEKAAAAGHDRVVCEVNSNPPNPASDAFHASLGFVEAGRADIHDGAKSVRYFTKKLSAPRPSWPPRAHRP
jgi:predicted GNAT superfamily acetyltransferase